MSLDVYLRGGQPTKSGSGIFYREDGQMKELTRAEWDERFPGREPAVVAADDFTDKAYSANITHNLNTMAGEAGIYEALWRPEEIGITTAAQLIPVLEEGLRKLLADPDRYKKFSPENGWGSYEGLVRFVRGYLNACRDTPTATVSVWR